MYLTEKEREKECFRKWELNRIKKGELKTTAIGAAFKSQECYKTLKVASFEDPA